MSISVKLEAFEGPLDLLLHLIDKNKVNIYDIPIAEITNQYLEYIRKMEKSNMDVMSEFLVMAATLIQIKSRMLIPKQEKEDEDEEDPRLELVRRLLEYKKFKHISKELKDKQLDAARMMYKGPTIPQEVLDYEEEIPVSVIMKDIDLSKLYKVFHNVMKKQIDKIDPIRSKFQNVKREEFSVSDKIDYVRELTRLNRKVSFVELLEQTNSKSEIIATFLSILELMKMGDVTIVQEDLFEMALEKAEKIIINKITAKDHEQLVDYYLYKVVA